MNKCKAPAGELPDMRRVSEMVDAFASSCAAPCRLLDPEGDVLYPGEPERGKERFCALCEEWLCPGQSCRQLHADGGRQAERFGGRYIYFCPMGAGWIAAPILLDGSLRASLCCGPMMMLPLDDYIAGTPALQERMTLEQLEQITLTLRQIPYKSPADMGSISLQLLAAAVYIGDRGPAMPERRREEARRRSIGEHLWEGGCGEKAREYPFEKERRLACAVADGDGQESERLLTELLGDVFFVSGGDRRALYTRSVELASVLSRAAVAGGADPEEALALSCRFQEETGCSDCSEGSEGLTLRLTRAVARYTDMVSEKVDGRQRAAVNRAISYVKSRLAEKVTLADAAGRAGFSGSHFSRLFKAEMGCTFSEYVNRLRVEQSKALLLTGRMSVQEVGDAVGYGEQSYFIRVFRKQTGVTPGSFRRRQGHLNAKTERDSAAI